MSLFLALIASLTVASSALALNWDSVKHDLGDRSYGNMAQVVRQLPAELRRNWILQAGSDSPQWATPEEPRPLLLSDDAKVLMGIAGGPNGIPKSNIIEFSDFNGIFYTPRLIVYRPNGTLKFIEDAYQMFPKEHPRACFHCHGDEIKDWKPVYDSYKFWRHSFGSGLFPPRKEIINAEIKAWAAFKNGNGKKGVYAELIGLQHQTVDDLSNRNSGYTHYLNANNEKRIIAKIKDNPIVKKYAREILAVLLADDREVWPTRHFRESLRAEFEKEQVGIWLPINKVALENTDEKMLAYQGIFDATAMGVEFDEHNSKIYTVLKFFMDKAGISMDDWPMTIKKGSYSFSGPLRALLHLSADFYTEVVRPNYPEWGSAIQVRPGKYTLQGGRVIDTPHFQFVGINRSETLTRLAQGVGPFDAPATPPPTDVLTPSHTRRGHTNSSNGCDDILGGGGKKPR